MKHFLNTAALFSKHGVNITFRILSALLLFSAAVVVYPELIAFVPHVAAVSVAVYLFTHLFVGKRSPGLMAATTQADIFNVSQLQLKDIIENAIYLHFGWTKLPNGEWDRSTGREIPKITGKQRITRKDLYDVVYLTPGNDTFKFFDKQAASKPALYSNLSEVSVSANKMFVFFGLQFELATGAGAADAMSALLFGQPTLVADAPVINGLVSYRANAKQELDLTPQKNLFVNDDAIKNFFRFAEPIVLEPSSKQEFELRLAAAYAAATHRYAKVVAIGYELIND